MKRVDVLRHYGLLLFAGFIVLFARLHYPVPFGGEGLLAIWPLGYLDLTKALNPFQWGKLGFQNQTHSNIQFGLLIILAFIFYWYIRLVFALQRGSHRYIQLKHILGGMLIFSLPFLFLPYILSTDIHIYIFYGRISAVHGANPVFTPPSAFAQDPFFEQVYPLYRQTPSVYGPIWMLLAHGLTLLVESLGGAGWTYVLGYKLVALLFHVVNTILLWRILATWKPRQQVWGTVLYAWSPLALIEFVGSAHNDGTMIFFILLAVWLAQRGRWRSALLALVGATLVKWIALVLLPLYAVLVLTKQETWLARASAVIQMAAISLATAVGCYIPFDGIGSAITALTSMPATTMFANSFTAFIANDVIRHLRFFGVPYEAREAVRDVAVEVLQWSGRALCVLAWLWAFTSLWRRPTVMQLVHSSCVVMLVVLGTASWFWPWYVTWPLALVPLLDWKPLGRAVTFVSIAVALVYVQIYGVVGPLGLMIIAGFCIVSILRQKQRALQAIALVLFPKPEPAAYQRSLFD